MNDKNGDTESLWQQLDLLTENDAAEGKFRQKLSALINGLITDDFEKLVQLLYRLDIDEVKLKKTLQEHPAHDAADMITDLIIERQLQKIRSRQQFNQQNKDIDENEKW